MELGMGIGWGLERKTWKGMGNECWTGGCWQGIGWQSVVGGEIGRDALQGVGGENWSFGGKILAGIRTEGVFYWHGNGGEKFVWVLAGVGGRILVSNSICM